MKIALVHDYLREWGGAEEVLAVLHEMYPEAPVFTAYKTNAVRLDKSWDVRVSQFNQLFTLLNSAHALTPLLPKAFQSFDLSQYNLVISSSSAYAKCVKVSHPSTHICYCHTVPRFLYGFGRERQPLALFHLIEKPFLPYLKRTDLSAASNVDHFMANSQVVAKRVQDFYGKGAQVIYPPVNVDKFVEKNLASGISNPKENHDMLSGVETSPAVGSYSEVEDPSVPHNAKTENGQYFVVLGRLSPIKQFDLAIRACKKLSLPLQVIGEGRDKKRLQSLAGPSVQFLGRLSDVKAALIIAHCKAIIVTTPDEDFGMSPLEVLGAGKPVIAFASEAAKETLIDGVTGPFFFELTVEGLVRVLANFDTAQYDAATLRAHAEKFSKERFVKEIRAFVEQFGQPSEKPAVHAAVGTETANTQ